MSMGQWGANKGNKYKTDACLLSQSTQQPEKGWSNVPGNVGDGYQHKCTLPLDVGQH